MLNELLNDKFQGSLTIEQLRFGMRHDLQRRINDNRINELSGTTQLRTLIGIFREVFDRLMRKKNLPPDLQSSMIEITMEALFELWRQSNELGKFFEEMRKQFTPPQLAAYMTLKFNGVDLDWLLEFFSTLERSSRRKHSSVKVLGIYYPRFFNGGVERFLSLIIPIYSRMGYRVVFFTDLIDEQYEYPMKWGGVARVVLQSNPNDLFNRLTELAEYVRQYKIDVFCSHSVMRILPTVLLFKLLGVPLVLELHGVFTSYVASQHPILQPRDKNHKIYRLADGLVVLSRVFETFWRNLDCNAYYIPNPLPPIDDKFSRDPAINRKTILWVGRIVEAKGIRAVLPIMREVVRRMPEARLRIVGGVSDEELLNELLMQIKESALEKNVELCGYYLDVSSFYETADVMLTTSPAEGFSYTIAESKLYALPMVCYELPYLELLRDGRGYINVAQNDAARAAAAIVEILTDDQLRARLSKDARESIEPFLNYNFADAWKQVFDDVIRNRRRVENNFEFEQIELLLMNEIWK